MRKPTGTVVATVGVLCLGTAITAAQERPDLSGIWANGVVPSQEFAPLDLNSTAPIIPDFARGSIATSERYTHEGQTGLERFATLEQDRAVGERGWINKPPYKAEYWTEVRLHDLYANAGGEHIAYADPMWQNKPAGIPRMGAPSMIVQTENAAILLYQPGNQFRYVPADCRAHNEVLAHDQTFYGHAVGCYEDGTLVVHSRGFTDQTWLGYPGWIHSTEMEVIERFSREGNVLVYDVTVIDPVMFTEPWHMRTDRLNLNTNPEAVLLEDAPYDDRALGELSIGTYRG